MFKTAARKIAHNTTIPSLGGNKDLRSLQDLITAEKSVLAALQKLSTEISKAAEALKAWGSGEGADLSDTLSASSTVLACYADALSQYATHEHTMRDYMKAVRTREEALNELRRKRKSLASDADSAERKLSKMGPEHKNLTAQTELLAHLRDQIRDLDAEIMGEEAKLHDFKRENARSWMALKFGGLVECCGKGSIVGDVGMQIITQIPYEAKDSQSGFPRAPYNGFARTEALVAEAQRKGDTIIFSGALLPTLGEQLLSGDHRQSSPTTSGSYGMPEPSPLAPHPKQAFLPTPQLGGPDLDFQPYLNASEISTLNEFGTPGQSHLESPQISQTFSARRGPEMDEFGVGSSAFTPGTRAGMALGGGSQFASFPVKGRQQNIASPASDAPSTAAARDNAFSQLADGTHRPDIRTSLDDPVPEYSSFEDGSAPAPRNASNTFADDSSARNGSTPPRLQLNFQPSYNDLQSISPAGSDTQLAYMTVADDSQQRVSRHVRWGEQETVGHGVGVVNTPTTGTDFSYGSTPVSADFRHDAPATPLPNPHVQDEAPSPVQPQHSPLAHEYALDRKEGPSTMSYRVPPPQFEDGSTEEASERTIEDERALNAAAAREISRELNSFNVNRSADVPQDVTASSQGSEAPTEESVSARSDLPAPNPSIQTTSPTPTESLSSRHEEGPPALSVRTASDTAESSATMARFNGSPKSLPAIDEPNLPAPYTSRAKESPLPPHPAPPPLGIPARSFSPPSSLNSPYRTPPEYPRMNKSATNLGSPIAPQGARTISAAAFRRPAARLASNESIPSTPVLPDIAPLALRKRTLPSNPYPPRLQAQETMGSAASGGHDRAGASASETTSLPQTSAPVEEEEFDYLSAYVDSGVPDGQVQSNRGSRVSPSSASGYSGGYFSTNLDDPGLK